MSPDDRMTDGPDDGLIHEWLDGELDAARSAELEALVLSSPAFAARVAEARGVLAASSRILQSLDDVPEGVLPARDRTERVVSARWSVRRWTSIAALLMVGVTGVVLARGERTPVRERTGDAISADAVAADAVAEPTALPTQEAAAEPAGTEPAPRNAFAQREAMPIPGADMPLTSGNTRRVGERTEPPAVSASDVGRSAVGAAGELRVMRKSSDTVPTRIVPPAVPQDVQDGNASARVASAAPAIAATPAPMRSLAPTASGERDRFLEQASDILVNDLAFGVRRVRCAPMCVQVRIEIARDGRVRRWTQALGASAAPEQATVSDSARLALTATIASLGLETLPTTLRLDGAQCRTVGSLRESLRVEFAYESQRRSVMGLPWCSDGKHILDRAADAIEAAAAHALTAP